VLLLGLDPDDLEGECVSSRVLAHVKSNVGQLAASLALSIETLELSSEIEAPRIIEVGISPYGGPELLSIEGSRRGSKIAGDGISGPRAFAGSEAGQRGTRGGETAGCLRVDAEAARQALGVKPDKLGFDAGWGWYLPELGGDDGEQAGPE
jgi:hypothetical protein